MTTGVLQLTGADAIVVCSLLGTKVSLGTLLLHGVFKRLKVPSFLVKSLN